MKQVMKTIIASSVLSVVLSSGAFANAITAWTCEKTNSGQTVKLTTQTAVSSSAVINIDSEAQTGAVTINGNVASTAIGTAVQCWAVDFTITDGGSTFGLN
jgi:hypothetical protein